MKRNFILLAVAVAATAISAEPLNLPANMKLGVEVGYDNIQFHTTATYRDGGDKESVHCLSFGDEESSFALNGFHFGPTLTYQFNDLIGLTGGFFYQYGVKTNYNYVVHNTYDGEYERITSKSASESHAFQIPVRAEVSHTFANGLGVMAVVGPVFNLGLDFVTYEKQRWHDSEEGVDFSKEAYHAYSNKHVSYYWYDSPSNSDKEVDRHASLLKYRWFDLKLGFGAGLTFDKMYVLFTYDFGLINRLAYDKKHPSFDRDMLHTDYYSHSRMDDAKLSIGYRF